MRFWQKAPGGNGLKHLTRNIRSNKIRRFGVSNLIMKNRILSLTRKLRSTQEDRYKIIVLKSVSLNIQLFSSKKVGNILKIGELKPKIIGEQWMIYHFKCGLCNMDYVVFTNRHLHQRIIEHTSSRSSIGKHMKQYGVEKSIANNFSVLEKCRNKLDIHAAYCFMYEILFYKISNHY